MSNRHVIIFTYDAETEEFCVQADVDHRDHFRALAKLAISAISLYLESLETENADTPN